MSVGFRILTGALSVFCVVTSSGATDTAFHGSVEVNVVTLKVVVTNLWETRNVEGLTRENFIVLEDGEIREISHFAEIADGREWAPVDLLEIDDLGARAISADRRRLMVLAFDMRTLLLPRLDRTARKLIQSIEKVENDNISWAIVLLGSEGRCVLPPTADPRAVVGVLNELIDLDRPAVMRAHRSGAELQAAGIPGPGSPSGPLDSEVAYRSSIDRLVRQLDIAEQRLGQQGMIRSLATTFRSFAALPGVKSLILFYARDIDFGTVSVPSTGAVADSLSDLAAFESRWRGLGRVASAAGFTLYAANVVGPQIPLGPDRESLSIEHASRILAVETGGGHFESNNPALAVKQAIRDTSRYYEISFAAPRIESGVHRDLKVKVMAPGIHRVRHSTGGYVVDPRFRIVDQLSTSADFPKVGGALPVEQELVLSGRGNRRNELLIRPCLDLAEITFVPDGSTLRAALDLFVAVHDAANEIVSLKHAREHLSLPLDWDGRSPSVYRPTIRLSLPQGRHTVTTALYDLQSELSGMASGTVHVPSAGDAEESVTHG